MSERFRLGVDIGGTYINARSVTWRLMHPNLL